MSAGSRGMKVAGGACASLVPSLCGLSGSAHSAGDCSCEAGHRWSPGSTGLAVFHLGALACDLPVELNGSLTSSYLVSL